MDRLTILEAVRTLALEGSYSSALEKISALIKQEPRDLDALRLKGNVLELQVMHEEAGQNVKFVYSERFGKARACYEQILLLQPDHLGALADLGTHWKNVGEYDKALQYLDRALSVLEAASAPHDQEALVDVLEEKMEILKSQGELEKAAAVEARLSGLAGQ